MLTNILIYDRESKSSGQSSSRHHASRPEALPLDFVVRPQSKVDPDEIRAKAKQVVQDQRRLKVKESFLLFLIIKPHLLSKQSSLVKYVYKAILLWSCLFR